MTGKAWIVSREPWHEQARCRGMGSGGDQFFPFYETPRTIRLVKPWCDYCPVRGLCLRAAMDSGSEGLWAGTTTKQRRAMARTRTRVKCPLCKSRTLAEADEFEICLGCGASWRADERPEDQQEISTDTAPGGHLRLVEGDGHAHDAGGTGRSRGTAPVVRGPEDESGTGPGDDSGDQCLSAGAGLRAG